MVDDELVRDLRNLRRDLCGELTAINDYQDHILEAADRRVAEVLQRIMNDEKEHVAMLTRLLAELDSEQRRRFVDVGWRL